MGLRIGTHDGAFHADEALGVFILQVRARAFARSEGPVLRTRVAI